MRRRKSLGPARKALLALLAAVLAGGGWWLAVRPRGDPSPPRDVSPGEMDPARAYRAALDLGTRGRHFESLPYYRSAFEDGLGGVWEVRRNYAAALNNAAFEVWTRGDRATPATRASVERVTFAVTALEALAGATPISAEPRLRARTLIDVGNIFESWGLPYDALAAYLEAARSDPTSSEARAASGRIAASLGVRTPPPGR